MAYSTQQDVQLAAGGEDRLRELSDWTRSAAVGEAEVTRAIEVADAWIDKHVGRRYGTSLNPVPARIRELSADEAVFRLKERRGMVTEVDLAMHKEREEEVKEYGAGAAIPGYPVPPKSSLVVDASSERDTSKDVSRYKLRGFS